MIFFVCKFRWLIIILTFRVLSNLQYTKVNVYRLVEISTDAVQIFGGYGYTKDYPVEKFYRDSKLCTIGEGTSEIQKLVISREVLKY